MNFEYAHSQMLATGASAPAERNAMPKGHKCPNCGKHTLQPYTTNQLKCSSCETIVKKGQVL